MADVCKSCSAAIVWAKSTLGKAMPLQIDPAGDWVILEGVAVRHEHLTMIDASTRYSSHFVSCPQAGQWRKRK